jgi:ATP-dependent helicase/nuclease subunit B
MRGVLDAPDKTAALVTRDRNLARRVAAELKRWDIHIDDSAGQPLANLPRARLLRLILQAHISQFAPVDMLALLKHPLVCMEQERGHHLRHVRLLENAVLRGPRPFGGISGMRALLALKDKMPADDKQAVSDLLTRLEQAFSAFKDLPHHARMSDYLTALIHSSEALLAAPQDEMAVEMAAEILFKNDEEGRALAALFDMLHTHSALAPPMTWGDFPALFDMWLMRQNVRRQAPGQPRLAILGPLEARLIQADVMILGGLNETIWPPMPETGPWLSRPMRAQLGMSQPERQIGQAAHDFVQAAAAPEIYLTRAKKIDGAPSVAARWLRRLETFAGKLPRQKGDALIGWWQSLDRVHDAPQPEVAPRPCPPVAARPKQLSVTQIETLLHNPYEIYARKILNLRERDAVDAPPNAAHRGIFLHALMEKFIAGGHHHAANPSAAFLDLAKQEEALHGGGAALMQFWQARLQALATWLADYEGQRAALIDESHVELTGRLKLGAFTVTAKADRIDRLKNGAHEIIDYKSGQPPSNKAVEQFLAPQLTLEAAILRDGHFGEKGAEISGTSAALTYLRLSGRTPAAEPKSFETNDALIDGARDMVRRLFETYDDAAQAYRVHIRPRQYFGANNLADLPFDHLARCPEWQEEDDA